MATKKEDVIERGKGDGRNKSVLGQNFMFPPSVVDDIHIKS
jgi:hypothetical protein